MSAKFRFIMAGGGTGGHIFPALAVAKLLREQGHDVLFIGTKQGMEARLVPEANFPIEFIQVGGLNRVGLMRQLKTLVELPLSSGAVTGILGTWKPDAVFSMGGFVAGPTVIAAVLRRVPLVIMEPNAIPGFTNRRLAPFVYRALVGFEDTARWFPSGKTEVTGLPIRAEFFQIEHRTPGKFTLLITGGSRGARKLNAASRESWPFFRKNGTPICIIHQTGPAEHAALAAEFQESGLEGEVLPFIKDMPGTFSEADLVLARSGAGSVAELAAAGMPSILVPLPFAADDHQRKNAEAFVKAGAAGMVLDGELSGERLYAEVEQLRASPDRLREMGRRVRQFAKPGAAERAAEVLCQAAQEKNERKRAFRADTD
jgi:UDP-N-acetylglucosamine--N-acetylmuramyl-(pentapeptide) pyrophosphoryl-undecaprenol N-acetylglucosamine transferase